MTTQTTRPPLQEIRILMPVWGRQYVRHLLELGLPSLLAEGNIPGVSAAAPCTFVLLTRSADAAVIEGHPAWQALRAICAVEIVPIDDLVSESSATVLTLAYGRAIRAQGAKIPATCFIFLVADYVVAAGSLTSALARIDSGADAVLAGNFQIAAESARPQLLAAREPDAAHLTIAPRQLVALGLEHPHPASLASTVNASKPLDARSNRMFWRVGDKGLVGRFYLLHMIAIRPQVSEFTIAAPSDYALVPELCPTGKIEIIADSDEYCVAEFQPAGAATPQSQVLPLELGRGIAEWATAQHRINSDHVLVFHADETGPDFAAVAAQSQILIDNINKDLGAPQPHRHHPYWARMLDHHFATSARTPDPAEIAAIVGYSPSVADAKGPRFGSLRRLLLGRAPSFRAWHPRWADFAALQQTLQSVDMKDGRVLLVGSAPQAVADTLTATAASVRQMLPDEMDEMSDVEREQLDSQFDRCLILSGGTAGNLDRLLAATAELLVPGAKVVVSFGDVFREESDPLPAGCTPPPLRESRDMYKSAQITCIRAGGLRVSVQRAMMRLARSSFRKPDLAAVPGFAAAGVLAMISAALNVGALWLRQTRPATASSSMSMVLHRIPALAPREVAGGGHQDSGNRSAGHPFSVATFEQRIQAGLGIAS